LVIGGEQIEDEKDLSATHQEGQEGAWIFGPQKNQIRTKDFKSP